MRPFAFAQGDTVVTVILGPSLFVILKEPLHGRATEESPLELCSCNDISAMTFRVAFSIARLKPHTTRYSKMSLRGETEAIPVGK
jgi:hypothetical protein